MVRSMTGFGKATTLFDEMEISCEVKSVNSRFLETNVKLPRQFSAFEYEIREYLKKYVQRGKVNIILNMDRGRTAVARLSYDPEIVRQYLGIAADLKKNNGINGDLELKDVLLLPEVITAETDPKREQELRDAIFGIVDQALVEHTNSRSAEGKALEKDIVERISVMQSYLKDLRNKADNTPKAIRERLSERLKEVIDQVKVDSDRLELEIALLAERADITEEIIRLESHFDAVRKAMDVESHPGKKLNFLAQEMHREANTIGSKSYDIGISHISVGLKEEIERIREQVQNIE